MAWTRAIAIRQQITDTQADCNLDEWFLIAQEFGFAVLEGAVRHVMRTQDDWFPSVKTIRDTIPTITGIPQGEKAEEAAAEAAWQRLMDKFRWYDESRGGYWIGGAPKLGDRDDQALRGIGGRGFMERSADRNYLHLLKKDFVEAWLNAPAVEAVRNLPAAAEVKRLAESKRFP
jgi:hypothetical protein